MSNKLRLDFTLPDWVNEKTELFIVGRRECVARFKYGYWEVKESRCSRCGECCRTTTDDSTYYDPETGTCKYLKLEHVVDGKEVWMCAHPDQPYDCVKGSGEGVVPGCTVKFRKV